MRVRSPEANRLMMVWLLLIGLALLLVLLGGRVVFRRYQDSRIREYRHRMAWREYRQRPRRGFRW